MKLIRFGERHFEIYIPQKKILTVIDQIAENINKDFASKNPLFLGVLNGSFMFMADLIKKISCSCEVDFVKVASYNGEYSTGAIKEAIGLTERVSGRDVIIVEDIIDTGLTVNWLIDEIAKYHPASLSIATLLLKPASLKKDLKIDYIGIEVPNTFLVGYGLDLNGAGRGLCDIYRLK